MPNSTLLGGAEANLAAAKADLERARSLNQSEQTELLDALISSGGSLLIYQPAAQHYGVLFGCLEQAHHIAIMVPGVGGSSNLVNQWLPSALNLYAASDDSAVILWKGFENPPNLMNAAVMSVQCNKHVMDAGQELTEFVSSLGLRRDQTLTLVAHSFGSTVAGCALADCNLICTDCVVLGSPGMGVDDLRQLHFVAWTFRIPSLPFEVVSRHYRGPGFRVMINTRRLIDVTATEVGNLVEHSVDRCLDTFGYGAGTSKA